MENGAVTEKKHAPDRFGRGPAIVLSVLAVWMTLFGSDKSPATSALQRFLSRARSADAVTSNDVARGFRMVGSDEPGPVAMPSGAVTNEFLRRRGGFDWAFRVEPDNWRSSWKDGFLTGVTVLARGEVRPDVGTLYYPVPFTNGVSLLPEARWGLLPNGGASVFSHAVTADGSLLLDWRNALVHDHNLVFNEGKVPVARWLEGKRLRLCDWKEYVDLGFDRNGCFAEARFRNPAKRDYRLREDSPGLTLATDGGPVGARNMPGLDVDQSVSKR